MPGLFWLVERPVAHRGLHNAAAGIIENTPSAISAAVAGNYAIEVDLQITADGEAMVHHDDVLGRLTDGSGALASMTAAQLKQVSFKATADRMMTLSDLCDLVDGRSTLVIELKSLRDGDPRVAERAAKVLAGYRGPAVVMSFDPFLIRCIRDIAPNLVRGLVAEKAPSGATGAGSYARDLIAAQPQFLAYSVKNLTSFWPLLARHVFRMPLLTWTVRTDSDRERAGQWADQMIFEGFRP